ncbi:MAG: beta-ketoacyl-[acyl-carrier-protein] synthase family protein [Desulfobulbaceae bacterium]|nr:beta-ketoacyl-[acyl-carrier-protein] synthase family protein [Desulfobulbaceae bacterium]
MSISAQKNSPIITGTGCICAAGQNTAAVTTSLHAATVNCAPIPDYLFSSDLTFPAFTVQQEALTREAYNFFLEQGVDPSALVCNRTLQLTLTALTEALQQAGYHLSDLRNRRVGIALGTTVGCTFNNEDYYIAWKKDQKPDIDPVFHYLDSNPALRLQKIMDVEGPCLVITNACASGTDAIGVGSRWLQDDLCDIVITGGADELSRIAYHGFAGLMLTANTPCRPFSADREGLNLGEGAGVLILEKQYESKKKKALGSVRGYGSAGDAHHPTAPHPEGRGMQQALAVALGEAKTTVEDIAYINSHGTGTPSNDRAESAALAGLGFTADNCPVVSTKGVTGHTLGAAGAIEAILTLEALRQGSTMGTIGCKAVDPQLHPAVLIEREERPLNGKVGISQSLAFGGGNAALVLEGYPA